MSSLTEAGHRASRLRWQCRAVITVFIKRRGQDSVTSLLAVAGPCEPVATLPSVMAMAVTYCCHSLRTTMPVVLARCVAIGHVHWGRDPIPTCAYKTQARVSRSRTPWVVTRSEE